MNTTSSSVNASLSATPAAEALAEALHSGSERVTPALVRAAEQAESIVRHGAEAVREQTAQLRDRAARATDRTVGYIQDEPLKAVLIAAAAGAALMAIANLAMRPRDAR